jgi:hypothetical protein
MPLIATRGAASAQGFGEFAQSAAVNYIEDVFSTWLYQGTTAVQTITNNVDLSTFGGMVWMKDRSFAYDHCVVDSARGLTNGRILYTSGTSPQQTNAFAGISSFNTNGFTLRNDQDGYGTNYGGNVTPENYVSWTFRKQPKFFDVLTYTGNDTGQAISHNLKSAPGTIIVKSTTGVSNWVVYHRSLGSSQFIQLSTTGAAISSTAVWGGVDPTSTQFTVGTSGACNVSGQTYVAYLFAHDAGGFGLTGTDNVISCGSFTASSGAATVTLGYEPQWILFKTSNSSGGWNLVDTMRGWSYSATAGLLANTSGAEDPNAFIANPTATGFSFGTGTLVSSGTYIYIAIRRGPMKVPTVGTSVFAPQTRTGTGSAATITGVGFPVDLVIDKPRIADTGSFEDRLRGSTQNLVPSSTGAETTSNSTWDVTSFASMDGISVGISGNVNINTSGTATVNWFFRRAPSFFDEVCYTATISAEQTFNHNLGVTPELIFLKRRDSARNWVCWQYQGTNGLTGTGQFLNLNLTAEANASTTYNDGYVYGVSATQFAVNGFSSFNNVNSSCVAYLFATCAGVSKVGSYTGNGSSQTINCGFTGGSRFVLIKATSTTGNWIVADSARGIVAGNDPALYLNSTAAEVTGLDWIDTDNSGFVVNETATIAANTNGVSYIFLAIA